MSSRSGSREPTGTTLLPAAFQEQLGHYGLIIIDPAGPDPVQYDREHDCPSDWTFMHPHRLFSRLAEGCFFNRNCRTLTDKMSGRPDPLSPEDARMFAEMRMDPTDISDVTAAAYTYLINGHSPAENWTGIFRLGERVRLRVINTAACNYLQFPWSPGMKLIVVATDGIEVRPVEVDEFQIGNAETYDLIVGPEDRAYTIVAETIDRSGMGVATPRAARRYASRSSSAPRTSNPDHDGHGHGWNGRRR